MALSTCYWANYMLTEEKLRRKSEIGAQNQLLSLKNRSQGKVITQDFGALLFGFRFVDSSSVIDCLERLVPEMTCYLSSGMLNFTD